nr:BMP family ABC transporter substrate-binding protein [Lachnospiraceae bacterium]
VYYEYAFKTIMEGGDLAVDWAKGYSENAVGITKLGDSCAAGTAEKVAEAEAALKAGTLHVFDASKFTVKGENLKSYSVNPSYIDWAAGGVEIYHGDDFEAITDGYFNESSWRSAPYFDIRIDGITEGITIE